MRPQEALERTTGSARLLVEWGCLSTVYNKSETSSRLSRNLGDVRFDEGTQQFVGVRPSSSWFSAPRASLRFDEAGRLESFSHGEIPLAEVVFELTAASDGWRALGFSLWSNTTILWFAANGKAFSRLAVLKGRRTGSFLGDGSSFVLGAEQHPALGWVASLAGGAAVARVLSRPVHRDTLGPGPVRLNLELPGLVNVTFTGTHVPRMEHAFEVDLTPRRVKPSAERRKTRETLKLTDASRIEDVVRLGDDELRTVLRAHLLQAVNDDVLGDAEEIELRLSAALIVVAALADDDPDLAPAASLTDTLQGIAELVATMKHEQLRDLLRGGGEAE